MLIITFASADYLYSKDDKCINDYYYKAGTFYYRYSKDGNDTDSYHYTTSNNYIKYIYSGYLYDVNNNVCYVPDTALFLGLSPSDYRSLMALVASLVGFTFLFFGIYIVIEVAKK